MARNKHPEETVKMILDTAARLFTEKGYEKASLQDIINETGLSKGAIYHHFASKEEIFVRICERIGEENSAVLLKIRNDKTLNGCDKLKTLFKTALLHANQSVVLNMTPYLLDNPKFLAMQIRQLYEDVVPNFVQPILEEGVSDGSLKAEHPKELAEVLMILTDVWLHPLMVPTSSESMKNRCQVFDQILRGMGMDLLDDEMTAAYIHYSELLNGQKDR